MIKYYEIQNRGQTKKTFIAHLQAIYIILQNNQHKTTIKKAQVINTSKSFELGAYIKPEGRKEQGAHS